MNIFTIIAEGDVNINTHVHYQVLEHHTVDFNGNEDYNYNAVIGAVAPETAAGVTYTEPNYTAEFRTGNNPPGFMVEGHGFDYIINTENRGRLFYMVMKFYQGIDACRIVEETTKAAASITFLKNQR